MERYGRTTEGSQSDPSPEWIALGRDTALDERSWPSGMEGAESYPERPGEADCIYYLRTGFCGYGSRCRFNHPGDRSSVVGTARTGGGRYPERVGQPVCQYYMKTGMCKYGSSCKYHHPRQAGGSISTVSLNYYGFPLRPGEKECSYYVKTGQCKFGATCKFHHPQPAGLHMPEQSPAPQVGPVASPIPAPTVYPPVQSPSIPPSQQYGVVVARPSLLPGSYVHGPYGPLLISPSVVPFTGWSPYGAPLSPVASPGTQPSVGSGLPYAIPQLSPSPAGYPVSYQPVLSAGPSSSSTQREHSFPERPGQPECQYYMRTGDCKFGSSCRYHHPPELIAPRTVLLNLLGLPLRPGAPPCSHFAQHGVCKFGPACRYDHSMVTTLSYSPSASSLVDMPVAPYPVGSTIGTLAPSSSSSESRPELHSASREDSSSARMSSSISISSGLAVSSLSRTGPLSHSSVQLTSQISGLSVSGGTKSGNTEARS